jgi:hypothetical protein
MSDPLFDSNIDRRAVLSAVGLGASRATVHAATAAGTGDVTATALSIVDYGARPDTADNTAAIQRAIAAARQQGRCVLIPPGRFAFTQLDLGRNDAAQPARLILTGTGTLHSTTAGTAIVASGGPFYDLVVDAVRFESHPGAGTALFDGDRFRRLTITPGTQIDGFDHVLIAREYLQSVRMLGVTIRGGRGAVVRAPQAYDCTFAHNIIEFVTDGFVIDGSGDPAANTCRILHNVIEGIGGRAIVLGACLATTVCGNYLEGNVGGDILLNAGTAPHKGLRVQDNSIQMSEQRLASGGYGIVWGRSTALPVRSGGNFCTGRLHDTRDVTALIDMTGDHSAVELYSGHRTETRADRKPIGRVVYSDGLSQHITWFDRYLTLDPYHNEVRFGGRFTSQLDDRVEPPVLTFGDASPQENPANFDRKYWGRGSVVFNAKPATERPLAWVCQEAGAPGKWAPA